MNWWLFGGWQWGLPSQGKAKCPLWSPKGLLVLVGRPIISFRPPVTNVWVLCWVQFPYFPNWNILEFKSYLHLSEVVKLTTCGKNANYNVSRPFGEFKQNFILTARGVIEQRHKNGPYLGPREQGWVPWEMLEWQSQSGSVLTGTSHSDRSGIFCFN